MTGARLLVGQIFHRQSKVRNIGHGRGAGSRVAGTSRAAGPGRVAGTNRRQGVCHSKTVLNRKVNYNSAGISIEY